MRFIQKLKLPWLIALAVLPFVTGIILVIALGQNVAPELAGLPRVPELTLWALPLSRILTDVSAVLTVGLLCFIGIIYPTQKDQFPAELTRLVAISTLVIITWLGGTLVQALFAISNIFALPLNQILDLNVINSVLTQTEFGKLYLGQFFLLGLALFFAGRIASAKQARATLLIVLAANFVPALGGHSGLSKNHELATSTMAVHILSISIWVGSLFALAIWFSRIKIGASIALNRFSQIALFSYFSVLVSGIVNAALRIGSFDNLINSNYGKIVSAKFLLTIGIGYLAFLNRRKLMASTKAQQFPTKLVISELLTIAVTLGLAVILARTGFPPKTTNYLPSLAEQILGLSVPESISIRKVFTSFSPDALWLTLVIILATCYIRGLKAVNVSWPSWRLWSFIGALSLLTFATSGSLGVYSHVLFSAHMIQHMTMALIIPLLLVFARPLTLAKLIGKKDSEFSNPIDWYISFYDSKLWNMLTKPTNLVGLTAFTYLGIYFTPIFPWLMSGHWGHVAMQVYLLIYGYALMWRVTGIDSGSTEISIKQIYLLLATEPIHILFGISLLLTSKVIGFSVYQIIDRPYLSDLAKDQKLGGIITLLIGEFIILSVLFWLVRQKSKATN